MLSSIQTTINHRYGRIFSSMVKVSSILDDFCIDTIQEYFLPNKMSTQLAKFAFLARTRMIPVGANFKAGNPFPKCPLCKVEYDSQKHLLFCPKLTNENTVCQEIFQYDDLFSKNLEKQIAITSKLHENLKKRKNLMKKK